MRLGEPNVERRMLLIFFGLQGQGRVESGAPLLSLLRQKCGGEGRRAESRAQYWDRAVAAGGGRASRAQDQRDRHPARGFRRTDVV
jgi:hypothetical protein